MRVSYIVPSSGRETLLRTLQSVELLDGDELLILGDSVKLSRIVPYDIARHPQVSCLHVLPGGNWGATERNVGMSCARGDILSFMDDDDVYLPGARKALAEAAPDRPTIFRMLTPDGRTLWTEQRLIVGNIGTPMIVVPNDPSRLGRWSDRYVCDFDFISSCRWPEISWNESVIAQVRPE